MCRSGAKMGRSRAGLDHEKVKSCVIYHIFANLAIFPVPAVHPRVPDKELLTLPVSAVEF